MTKETLIKIVKKDFNSINFSKDNLEQINKLKHLLEKAVRMLPYLNLTEKEEEFFSSKIGDKYLQFMEDYMTI